MVLAALRSLDSVAMSMGVAMESTKVIMLANCSAKMAKASCQPCMGLYWERIGGMCAVQTRLSCGDGPAELSGSNLNELMGISEGIFRDVLGYDVVMRKSVGRRWSDTCDLMSRLSSKLHG